MTAYHSSGITCAIRMRSRLIVVSSENLDSCVPVVQPTKDSRFKLHSGAAAPFIQKYGDNEGGGPDGA